MAISGAYGINMAFMSTQQLKMGRNKSISKRHYGEANYSPYVCDVDLALDFPHETFPIRILPPLIQFQKDCAVQPLPSYFTHHHSKCKIFIFS